MGQFSWLGEAAAFLLAPFKLAFYVLKVFSLLAMGVVIFTIWGMVWLANPEKEHAQHVSYMMDHIVDSRHSAGTPLGNVPLIYVIDGSQSSNGDTSIGTVLVNVKIYGKTEEKIEWPHQALSFCGQGDKFLSHTMQNDYWDHWYERKTGWLYQRYVEGSLNIYALKYVVTQLKSDKPVVIGSDFIDNCPNSSLENNPPQSWSGWNLGDTRYAVPDSNTSGESMIPRFDVMWHLEGPYDPHQDWPVITGYCLAGRCGKNSPDFLLTIDRWNDILAPEPKYTSGQQEAIDAFKATRTEEFWEKYAEANGLDPHSVDKYWEETQKAIKATVHLKKVSSEELDKDY